MLTLRSAIADAQKRFGLWQVCVRKNRWQNYACVTLIRKEICFGDAKFRIMSTVVNIPALYALSNIHLREKRLQMKTEKFKRLVQKV